MKLQKLSVVAGAIALGLIGLTATTFAVKANTTSSSPLIVAQAQAQASKKDSFEQRLGLTNDQKAKMKEIHENTRAEIEKILTPDQQAQLKTAMQSHQGWRRAIASLNLTEDQKNQLHQVMQSQKIQMDEVLTAEQKQQIQQMRENRPSRGQQDNP